MAPSSSSQNSLGYDQKKRKVMDDHEKRTTTTTPNWLDLPQEVTALILHNLDATEIMSGPENVCTDWQKICRDSDLMWRTIHMNTFSYLDLGIHSGRELLCQAIDRSCGHLEDIDVDYIHRDLLRHIANNGRHLCRLRLKYCELVTDEAFIEAAEKLPLLEELEIQASNQSGHSLEAMGRCCPRLRSLKFSTHVGFNDDEAFAIAKSMPKLLHLCLIDNCITNDGLFAILDGCPLLETLKLLGCSNVCLEGSVGRRCYQQIQNLQVLDDYCTGKNSYEKSCIYVVLME